MEMPQNLTMLGWLLYFLQRRESKSKQVAGRPSQHWVTSVGGEERRGEERYSMIDASRLKLYTSASVNCITINFLTATIVPVGLVVCEPPPRVGEIEGLCTSPQGLVYDTKGSVAERRGVELELLVCDLVVGLEQDLGSACVGVYLLVNQRRVADAWEEAAHPNLRLALSLFEVREAFLFPPSFDSATAVGLLSSSSPSLLSLSLSSPSEPRFPPSPVEVFIFLFPWDDPAFVLPSLFFFSSSFSP